ncbi:MAG TPA: sugar-transfer associated ATP-grasp domain-containing protein [Candidatus Acidoferrum sp.]|nr:sugar-transfer associated ATP-grasp domain-containing protein [Candidatus Acidoferrum sp.]
MRAEEIVKFGSGAAVLWAGMPDDGTPATFLHRTFQRQFWRQSGPLARAGSVAILLAWPFVMPALIGFFTQRNGPSVRARTGKGILRQAWEQAAMVLTRAILPPWYYIFELHDDGKRRRAGEYLHRFETKRFAYEFLRRTNGGESVPALRSTEMLSDKALFTERCRDYQLPAVPVLMVLHDGAVAQRETNGALLPPIDLFVKLIRGTGGRGAERWDYLGEGLYRDAHGHVLSAAALVARLQVLTLTARKGYIVQPRLTNHRELRDLSNGGALATVRVMTCRNERGEYEVTNAAFRMAQGVNTVVDNFHAGGILAKVDIRTGVLGRATDGAMALGPGTGWCERHPQTGGQILGRKLPLWLQVLDLARRAHATAFSDHVVIGWDIAILDDGPRLIEGNKGPDLDLVQRSHGEPLGNSRFGQLLAYNLKRSLASASVPSAQNNSAHPSREPRE